MTVDKKWTKSELDFNWKRIRTSLCSDLTETSRSLVCCLTGKNQNKSWSDLSEP